MLEIRETTSPIEQIAKNMMAGALSVFMVGFYLIQQFLNIEIIPNLAVVLAIGITIATIRGSFLTGLLTTLFSAMYFVYHFFVVELGTLIIQPKGVTVAIVVASILVLWGLAAWSKVSLDRAHGQLQDMADVEELTRTRNKLLEDANLDLRTRLNTPLANQDLLAVMQLAVSKQQAVGEAGDLTQQKMAGQLIGLQTANNQLVAQIENIVTPQPSPPTPPLTPTDIETLNVAEMGGVDLATLTADTAKAAEATAKTAQAAAQAAQAAMS